MKIAGLTYLDGEYIPTMKSDSSLLNQRKPFFMPDGLGTITATESIAVRICRLGRNIQPKFALRYADAYALALDFRAEKLLRQGRWTEGAAFDCSLAVGQWTEPMLFPAEKLPQKPSIEEAIATISKIMTIRTGDIIYINTSLPKTVEQEQIYTLYINNEENLYCKIK